MSDDKYNGWTNRETWALNLHIENDQGLSEDFTTTLRHAYEDYDYLTDIDGAIREWAEDLFQFEHLNEHLFSILLDVGSLWRVNWKEIVDIHTDEFWITAFNQRTSGGQAV